MGVFEFVLLIVLITTIGKVIESRRGGMGSPEPLPGPSPDAQRLEQMVGELNERLVRLEEERDFYRALLDSPPETRRRLAGEDQGETTPQRRADG